MSSFSPYLHPFENLQTSQDDNLESYYNRYTLLATPVEDRDIAETRNLYKISLAQIINYFVDFGIGYNSVCETTLTSQQEFLTGMYVNRHKTESVKRPATVADLKAIVEAVVRSMVNHTVYQNRDPRGMRATNNVYPTYIFTLDEKLTTEKIKELTNKDYIEIADFTDFPCTNSKDYNMPNYESGFVPRNIMLVCPKHGHTADDSMKKSWKYHWNVKIGPKSKNIIWSNHAKSLPTLLFTKYNLDDTLRYLNENKGNHTEENASYSCTPSWEYPNGVTCYENTPVYPKNTIGESVSIRWPGRRYRLFKQVSA